MVWPPIYCHLHTARAAAEVITWHGGEYLLCTRCTLNQLFFTQMERIRVARHRYQPWP